MIKRNKDIIIDIIIRKEIIMIIFRKHLFDLDADFCGELTN